MFILTIVILLILTAVSFFYFSYNEIGSLTFEWLNETGVLPMAWVPYIIGFLILFLLAAWIISFIITLPKRIKRSGQIRSLNKSRKSLDRGLMEINAGELEAGEASLTSYLEGNPADAVKYMAAAKSALARGADGQAEEYLKKAGDVSNHAGDAVRLTQAEMMLQRGEYKDAETLLISLNNSKPRNAHILLKLAESLKGSGNTTKLAEITKVMRSKTNIPKDVIQGFEQDAWSGTINAADEADLVRTFEQLPKESRRDEAAVGAYAQRLLEIGEESRAVNALQQAISTEWSEKLVDMYGQIQTDDPGKMLEQATGWLANQPRSPALALTLGRLSSQKQLWGQAKEKLIKAAQLNLTPAVCTELGDVLNAMGDSKNATDCYKSAASLASGKPLVGALRDLDQLAEQLAA